MLQDSRLRPAFSSLVSSLVARSCELRPIAGQTQELQRPQTDTTVPFPRTLNTFHLFDFALGLSEVIKVRLLANLPVRELLRGLGNCVADMTETVS